MSRGPRLLPVPVGQDLVGLNTHPDWTQIFGFDGPLELEIGCGMGHHAVEYAAAHLDVRYVAFEWRKKWARDVQRRADARSLRNLRVIEADARMEIPRLFRAGTLDVVRLQFPDPWWKRSHHKRAILNDEFTPLLLSLLRPGGLFDLRTDVEDRGREMLTRLEAAGFHNPLGRGAFHPPELGEIPSSRERRYLISGAQVYRARLRRPATPE